MMDATFIEAIAEKTQPQRLTVNGKDYSTGMLFNPPLPEQPPFPAIKLYTLDSLVDYIAANRDAAELSEAQIVVYAQQVHLLGRPQGDQRKRDLYVDVVAGVEGPSFGGYMPIEDFRIYLLTKFRDMPDRETILRFIARISDEHVATSEDNGVSQSVTVRSGIATHAQSTVPSPVQLAPIRTFVEVDQPVGHFLFRLKQAKDALPTAALFELHTNWKRDAAVAVKVYLDAVLKGKQISIPVFA